jgi:phosphate starvation-inducible PhoH-like protein
MRITIFLITIFLAIITFLVSIIITIIMIIISITIIIIIGSIFITIIDITIPIASDFFDATNLSGACVSNSGGFDNAFIIVDETQNITTHELKMLLTRVGEGTTIVLNGDVQQSDLKEADGLSKVIHLAKKHMLPVPIIEFGVEDIVRSDICAQWVKVFMAEKL